MILQLTLLAAASCGAESPSLETAYGMGRAWTHVWVQGGKKVGESTFQLERTPAPATGGETTLRIEAQRSYDREGISHRAKSVTECGEGGAPRRYKETLNLSAFQGRRSEQETEVALTSGKATLKYVQNRTKTSEREVEVAAGARLLGSQAVEHWAALVATFERGRESWEALVFYPDFGESFPLSFRKSGEESIRVGSEEQKCARYAFSATRFAMNGTLWVDDKGRLVQIEFPNARDPNLTLRVTLTRIPEDAAAKPRNN